MPGLLRYEFTAFYPPDAPPQSRIAELARTIPAPRHGLGIDHNTECLTSSSCTLSHICRSPSTALSHRLSTALSIPLLFHRSRPPSYSFSSCYTILTASSRPPPPDRSHQAALFSSFSPYHHLLTAPSRPPPPTACPPRPVHHHSPSTLSTPFSSWPCHARYDQFSAISLTHGN